MKKTMITFAVAFVALFAVNTAQAQNAHLVSDAPHGIDENGCAYASIAGIGNKNKSGVTVQLILEVTYSYDCRNTNTGNIVGNTRRKSFSSESVTYTPDRNGRVNITGLCTTENISLTEDLCGGVPLVSENESTLGKEGYLLINGQRVDL